MTCQKASTFVLALLFAIVATSASAQQATPDAGAMAGIPLPAGDVPDASVTVRVLRERMGNNIEGQLVTLRVGGESRTGTTDAQGRAQFTGLTAGATVQASATVDGEVLTSQEFAVPARGGIRVALISGIQKRRSWRPRRPQESRRDRASSSSAPSRASSSSSRTTR
jgi:hypothetical protein